MKKKIFLCPPHMGGNEQMYINKAFENNWIAPLGENVDLFESDLCQYLNIPENRVVALSSGTAALHLALLNLDVKQNDEILASSFTFSASINPIIYVGAKPVFIDSEKETWNMNPELLEKAIKERLDKGKKIKAILLVHLYGMPAQIDRIIEISNLYNIPIIEDAAEALGSSYNGQKLGTFGDYGILSFNGNKMITTSGGGALICRNPENAKHTKFLATQAKDPAPHYEHSHIGYNYRLSNILAGIGRGQMEVLEEHIKKHRYNHEYYLNTLGNYAGFKFLKEPSHSHYSNFWLTTLTIDPEVTGGISRETIRLHLHNNNVESRPLWKPMHMQPIFKSFPAYIDGTSEELFANGLCLPSGSSLKDNELKYIVELVTETLSL